jgi:hypothetical protein
VKTQTKMKLLMDPNTPLNLREDNEFIPKICAGACVFCISCDDAWMYTRKNMTAIVQSGVIAKECAEACTIMLKPVICSRTGPWHGLGSAIDGVTHNVSMYMSRRMLESSYMTVCLFRIERVTVVMDMGVSEDPNTVEVPCVMMHAEPNSHEYDCWSIKLVTPMAGEAKTDTDA